MLEASVDEFQGEYSHLKQRFKDGVDRKKKHGLRDHDLRDEE